MFASTFAKKYNDPNKTSCTRRYILSAISFPPSETVQVHGPRASRHGYLYSICGKRDEWRGGGRRGGGKERIGWWIKVYSFLSLIAKDFQPLSSLYFDVVRGGGEIKKKMCGAFSIDLQKNDGYSCVKSSNFFFEKSFDDIIFRNVSIE